MRRTVRHLLAFGIGDGRFGWPVCVSTRGPKSVDTMETDPERVTCLKCLDHYTRPGWVAP